MLNKQSIFDGNELQNRLLGLLPRSKEIIIISAFMTVPAVLWLRKLIKDNDMNNIQIISRLLPRDLITGASDIEAIKLVLSYGWEIRALSNLHAKIYLLDNHTLFVGSANLTSNGLKLIGNGNIEAMTELIADEKSLLFIKKIISASSILDSDILNKMSELIKEHKQNKGNEIINTWPNEIIKRNQDIFVSDFPLGKPNTIVDEYITNNHIPFAIIESLRSNSSLARNQFLNSNAYKWLEKLLLSSQNNELYFGAVSSSLHDSLSDDPTPYRRNIKILLSNLLLYIEEYASENIQISRPRHSQLIRVLK